MGWVKHTLVVCSLSLICSQLLAAPEKVKVRLKSSFVPIGFDDNDNAQAVVEGELPDTCHKVGPTEAENDDDAKIVKITQWAYKSKGICLKVKVPFHQVVNLGVLKEGTYKITDSESKEPLGEIPIGRSKAPSPDDFLYAPVTQVNLKLDGEYPVLSLRGQFNNRCMRLKDGEPEVKYYEKVVVVLPIAEWLGNDKNCDEVEVSRFQKDVTLRALKGATLIHVRSMNGQSLNQMFDFSVFDRK